MAGKPGPSKDRIHLDRDALVTFKGDIEILVCFEGVLWFVRQWIDFNQSRMTSLLKLMKSSVRLYMSKTSIHRQVTLFLIRI